MNKQELIDSMIRLATELQRKKLFVEDFEILSNDDEYYLIAELYRTLDQYTLVNDIVICDADRWI